jgi:hypothetical protein
MALSLDELVRAVEAGELVLADWAPGLDWAMAERVQRAARAEVARLPVPIRAAVDNPEVRRRRVLERILGHLASRDGDFTLLTRAERVAWLRGGSHVAYLRVLARAGRVEDAAALARTLIGRSSDAERDALEAFLAGLSQPPADWEEHVARLAESPTEEAWDALLRFTPAEHVVERQRYTVHLLLRLGVAGDHVFRLAARHGVTSEILRLVEEGHVDPLVIEAFAETCIGTREMWLGFAARAACVRGDRLGSLRLLRRAHVDLEAQYVESDLHFIAEHADDTLKEMLASAGIDLPEGQDE